MAVQFLLPAFVLLAGTVTGPAGPVVGASVSLFSRQSGEAAHATTDGSGQFRADLPAGTYEVYTRAPGFQVSSVTLTLLDNAPERIVIRPVPAETPDRPAPATLADPGIGDPGPRAAKLGGKIRPAERIRAVPPVYPPAARDAGIHGEVELKAVVLMNGTLASITAVSSPSPLLTAAARDCVSQWRYRPARLHGMPVESVTTIRVQFEIQERQ